MKGVVALLGVTDSVHEPAGTEPYCDELANATPVATVGPFCTDTSTSGALSEALTIRTLAWLEGGSDRSSDSTLSCSCAFRPRPATV